MSASSSREDLGAHRVSVIYFFKCPQAFDLENSTHAYAHIHIFVPLKEIRHTQKYFFHLKWYFCLNGIPHSMSFFPPK